MTCKCGSNRILHVAAETRDVTLSIGKISENRMYSGMNIGEDEFIDLKLCLDCGSVQGRWPLPKTEFEKTGKNNVKKRAELKKQIKQAKQFDTTYSNLVDKLVTIIIENNYSGYLDCVMLLFLEDDITAFANGLKGLLYHTNDRIRIIGETLIDKLQEWEKWLELHEALKLDLIDKLEADLEQLELEMGIEKE